MICFGILYQLHGEQRTQCEDVGEKNEEETIDLFFFYLLYSGINDFSIHSSSENKYDY
jgi:hypothetical protein